MRKALLFFALLLFCVSLVTAQTYNVTFKVNMNIELSKGKLTAADQVSARGNFNGWGESALTDTDADGVYEATIAVDASTLEAGTGNLFYKFYHNGAGSANWESDINGGNRVVAVTADKVLDAAFFNSGFYSGGGTYTGVATDVTFSVDMTLPINQDFNPATGHVYIAGSFTDWGTSALEMTDPDGDKVYSITTSLNSGTVVYYKFVYGTGAASAGTWESPTNTPSMSDVQSDGGNRIHGVTDGANTVARFWNNADPNVQLGDGNIDFTIDMGVVEALGVFDPAADGTEIRGGFNGWSNSDPAKSVMNQNPLFVNEWFITIPFDNQEVGADQTYKYYAVLSNAGIWTDPWERPLSTGGGDRSVTFEADPSQEVDKVYYDDVHPEFVVPQGQFVQITFRVDMSPAFNPDLQAVPMEAADRLFWRSRQPLFSRVMGWTDNDEQQYFELFDADGDMVYEGTLAVNGPGFNGFEYIYRYQKASDNSWQGEPTALGTTISGRVRYIPQSAAQVFTQPYTAPLDTWLNQADKSSQFEDWPEGLPLSVEEYGNELPTQFTLEQNYPNPFNPSTTIRFSIPSDELVNLKIYNALGQEVAVLLNKDMKAGSYEYKFDASRLSSGVYFYTINAGSFNTTKKMLFLK